MESFQLDGDLSDLAGELVVAFLVIVGHIRFAILADVRAFVAELSTGAAEMPVALRDPELSTLVCPG